jgi:hypothetical protein
MALEDRGAQHDKEVVDKFIDPNGSVEMTTLDYVVRPSAMTWPMVIVLPPVAEAKGRFYSIVARHASAQNTIVNAGKMLSSPASATAFCSTVMDLSGISLHLSCRTSLKGMITTTLGRSRWS